MSRLKDWGNLFVALAAATLLGLCALIPSGAQVEKDAFQNLSMAYNLVHHGVMSIDTETDPEALRPSRYREPLPVLVIAAFLVAFEDELGNQSLFDLSDGKGAKLLKYSNLLWGALLLAVVALSTWHLTGSRWMAGWAILLSYWPLNLHYDELYTEVPAAALIALVSYLCWRALLLRRRWLFFALGLSFGALLLTKASFLYVAMALVMIYIGAELYFGRTPERRRALLVAVVTTIAGTVVLLAPWMIRNQIELGSPNIADRGGAVLMTRAVKNGMTWHEYIGSFYVYAPYPLRPLTGWLTGHKPRDLEAGGDLERLRRRANEGDLLAAEEGRIEDCISYYYRAKAMRAPLVAKLTAEGHPNPIPEADAMLQDEAIRMILADPLKHIAMIVPFIYRGALFMFPFFCFMLFYAWRRRDGPLAAFVLPSLGLIGFYGVFSHFIPRYADPSAPVVAVCIVVLVHRWWEKRKKLRAES